MNALQWWRSGSARQRRRRRLLVSSAPVALLLVLVIAKLVSVGWAGHSAASDFAERDADALRGDVETLRLANVVEPAKAFFAAGTAAVLDGRPAEADVQFTQALARTDPAQSCPIRVNLELVRETLGDNASGVFDAPTAVGAYRGALDVVEGAPAECFAGNADSDEERRALRDDAANRLNGKIVAVQATPPPPPPQAPPAPVAPPPVAGGAAPPEQAPQRRLDPGTEPPLQKLQRVLRDAATARGGGP